MELNRNSSISEENNNSGMTPQLANFIKSNIENKHDELQDTALKQLLSNGRQTIFGQDHNFNDITDYSDFKRNVPIREYKDLFIYWDMILKGYDSVVWPGKPDFLVTTSASTGSPKYLPSNTYSISNFIGGFVMTITQYMHDSDDLNLLNYNSMNFTGSSKIVEYCGYKSCVVSGLTRLLMPQNLAQRALPTKSTIELMDNTGWDAMFRQASIEATELYKPVGMCSGLPSWIAQFFSACCEYSNSSNLTPVLPDLRLLCTSGVNYRPYLPQFQQLFDHKINMREIYAASEGFFAYQDLPDSDENRGMLLNLTTGIYFEFIELNDYSENSITRINLADVKLNVPYIMVITTPAGLWGYKMGDIVEFTSVKPYRISILGRTAHFISIQAEHVYSQHVESTMQTVNDFFKIDINNFTVAPNDITDTCLPYYNWYIETPQFHGINVTSFATRLDQALIEHSAGYAKGRKRKSLDMPKVHLLKPGAFLEYLKTRNSSSLQLKVPKVSNSREIAEFLITNRLLIDN